MHCEPTWKLRPTFLEFALANLSKPIASDVKAPNFLDRSISACSFDTATLTNKLRSFDLFVLSKILINWCKKYSVKYFCSNEVFYLNKKDSDSHDILLCVKNGELKETPIGHGRDFRFGLPSKEYYFKSTKQITKEEDIILKYELLKSYQKELLKTSPASLTNYYKEKVNEYFNSLIKEDL